MIIWIEKCEKEPSQELYNKWIRSLYSDDIYQASKRKVTSSKDLKKNKKIQKEQQENQL